MNLVTFIQDAQVVLNNRVIVFTGQAYPLLFFSAFLQQLKAQRVYNVQSIDLTRHAFEDILPQLELSFLGQASFFWFSDVTALDERTRKTFLAYSAAYKGPNKLAFFIPEEDWQKNASTVTCNAIQHVDEFKALAAWLMPDKKNVTAQGSLFLQRAGGTLSIDQAIMLIFYSAAVGNRSEAFVEQWLDKLSVPEQSLFTLSSLLFAKKPKQFLAYWQVVQSLYSDVFWTTYWSEQSFRAYWFVYHCFQKNMAEAKKIGFRLPFSFMQSDWRKTSLQELSVLHDAMYTLDCSLKNGGSASFDLIFARFLSSN